MLSWWRRHWFDDAMHGCWDDAVKRHPPGDLSAQLTGGSCSQLDRVSRELLARAWAAGAGPGDEPLTIDLAPPSARPTDWARRAPVAMATGQRGYHPLLAVAADTGDVLMVRRARAGPPRGARTTSCGRRWAGCATPETGQLTGADSGFYTHAMVAVCRKISASPKASTKAYPRRTGRRAIGWTAPLTWPRLNTHPSSMSRRRANAAHRSRAHARFPTGAAYGLQLSASGRARRPARISAT